LLVRGLFDISFSWLYHRGILSLVCFTLNLELSGSNSRSCQQSLLLVQQSHGPSRQPFNNFLLLRVIFLYLLRWGLTDGSAEKGAKFGSPAPARPLRWRLTDGSVEKGSKIRLPGASAAIAMALDKWQR
jgi:hypothetical protein